MGLSLQATTLGVTVTSGIHQPMISTEQLPPLKTSDESCCEKKWSSPGLPSPKRLAKSLGLPPYLYLEVPGLQQFTECLENL